MITATTQKEVLDQIVRATKELNQSPGYHVGNLFHEYICPTRKISYVGSLVSAFYNGGLLLVWQFIDTNEDLMIWKILKN